MYHRPSRPIVIKPANEARLQAALTAAEGRATSRRISAEDLIRLTEELDMQMRRYSTYKALEGLVAKIAPHVERFPRAYKWRPEGTACNVEYSSGSWKLLSCCREYCDNPADASQIIYMPPSMHDEIISRAYDLRL